MKLQISAVDSSLRSSKSGIRDSQSSCTVNTVSFHNELLCRETMVPKITLYTRIWIKLKEASSALGGIFGVGYSMVRPLRFGSSWTRTSVSPRETLFHAASVEFCHSSHSAPHHRQHCCFWFFIFLLFLFPTKPPHHIFLNTLAQYYSDVVSI